MHCYTNIDSVYVAEGPSFGFMRRKLNGQMLSIMLG